MKKFCLVTNALKDKGLTITKRISDYLKSKGCEVLELTNIDFKGDSASINMGFRDVDGSYDCCIVLGGDGTLIRTARKLSGLGIPLVGINLGMLGFLSVVEKDNIEKSLDELIAGRYDVEERFMLKTDDPLGSFGEEMVAVNDVVVTRSGKSRLICVRVKVGNERAADFLGDGVIISTPTGSTGYNLSAGGPIVTPKSNLMVITPICPHSLNSRSIVVSGDEEISLEISSKDGSKDEQALVTVDGQDVFVINASNTLEVERADRKVKLIRFMNQSFFEILDKKMISDN